MRHLEEHPAVTFREEEEGETDADAEFDAEARCSDFEDADDHNSQGYVTSNRKCSNEAICDRSDPPESTYISLFSQTHTGALIPPSPSPRVKQNYDISLSDYSNMTQVVSIALSIEISMSCA